MPMKEGGSWVSKGADEFLGGDVVECGAWAPFRSEIEAWEHLDRTGFTLWRTSSTVADDLSGSDAEEKGLAGLLLGRVEEVVPHDDLRQPVPVDVTGG